MSFWKWSRTPSLNATADAPSINWAEAQAPSTVNDSARGMMASAAKFRDDISGAITTGGASSAYSVTSYQGFDTLANMNGAMIAFTPHTTSAATVTLNVDSLGAKPLRFAPGAANELPAGSLVQGTPYVATYFNATAEWILQGLAGNLYNIPLGGMIEFTGTTAPNSSFVLPFGQAISRSLYPAYFAMVGTTYGAGNGTDTFNVIDKRGRVAAGKHDMGGSPPVPDRLTSTYFGANPATLGAVGGGESHILTTAQMPIHSHANTLADPGHVHTEVKNGATGADWYGGDALSNSEMLNPTSGNTGSSQANITITNVNAGGGNPHPIVQPTVIVNYILRVL